MPPLRLCDVPPGASCRVTGVLGAADGADRATVARRLRALGFVPGATVEVVRRAPLRDPVVYRVCDYRLCLRRAEAGLVEVELA